VERPILRLAAWALSGLAGELVPGQPTSSAAGVVGLADVAGLQHDGSCGDAGCAAEKCEFENDPVAAVGAGTGSQTEVDRLVNLEERIAPASDRDPPRRRRPRPWSG
jgi:hypothetical protein